MSSNPEIQANKEVNPVEIERKYVIDPTNLPENLENYPHQVIHQGYLVIGSDGSETRLRDRAGVCTLTVKSKGGLSRGEHEIDIDSTQFTALWPATEGKRLEKTRYVIPNDNGIVELDIYKGSLAGLVVAEVEFNSTFAADTYVALDWFGQEVTEDSSFKNQSLALYGIPEAK